MDRRIPDAASLTGTLHVPRAERDACGTGFIADVGGAPSRRVVSLALRALERLAHRGAVDADGVEATGDGAGVLTQVPLRLLGEELGLDEVAGAALGDVGVGMCFLPAGDAGAARELEARVQREARRLGMRVLAWRDVPTDPTVVGRVARATRPDVRQVLLARPRDIDVDAFEGLLLRLRRVLEGHGSAIPRVEVDPAARTQPYWLSMSSRTIVYKGLLVASQLRGFFPDLADHRYVSAVAVFHQRFSTNTFPTWERAQPMRMLAHNGEINTVDGNVAWMRARRADLRDVRGAFGGGSNMPWVRPVVDATGSDSGMLDNVLELVVRGGRSLPHAVTMLLPAAWEAQGDLPADQQAFRRYHAGLIEPWDGPAALSFTDGVVAGQSLDRNGLRPARYVVTDDGLVACASEAGAIPIDEHEVVRRGKLGPGELLVVDMRRRRVYLDPDVQAELAARQPYGAWLAEGRVRLQPGLNVAPHVDDATLTERLAAFGATREESTTVLRPMASSGHEAVGSMGDDTAHAVLSPHGRPLAGYFKQRFAEVTNPPIDPIRERSSMSLSTLVGARGNLLEESPEQARLIELPSPVLAIAELDHLRAESAAQGMRPCDLPTTWTVAGGAAALDRALDDLVDRAIEVATTCGTGGALLCLTDRGVDLAAGDAPMPALLALGAVHVALVRAGLRMRVSIVVDSGEARDVHTVAALVGFGATAVCPYLALEAAAQLATGERPKVAGRTPSEAAAGVVGALERGLLKVLSKLGISSVDAYCGAGTFEAVGIGEALVDRCFPGTPSRVGGIGLDEVVATVAAWHARAVAGEGPASTGLWKFKRDGEDHAFSPAVVRALHAAVSVDDVLEHGFAAGLELYRDYSELANGRAPAEPRDLLGIRRPDHAAAVPIGEVQPASAIVRRFSTGAMSLGSLSPEAHEAIAVAMNRLGGMSNSGEGGESPDRFGTERASAIKQVASARFGVTPAYLQSALELQVKMAQGSKPGEGGQLPGLKVTPEIAAVRLATPGVTLISPPPHHDIYSIEDLAQLIHDLRAASPTARVSVKLVAEAGVGTIAAGVAKAHADTIVVSGHSGGTGASPLSSVKHAGLPWELGLAETQQVLVANGLRGQVRLRIDGGLRTGRDVVVAALLGADEFSFGTSALVAEGCQMARACHNDTCPVGIATQSLDLRAKFPEAAAERVAAFLLFVAEEVRELLAGLGARSLREVVGRVDLLEQVAGNPGGTAVAQALDLGALLAQPDVDADEPRRHVRTLRPESAEHTLDRRLVEELWPLVESACATLAGAGAEGGAGARDDAPRPADLDALDALPELLGSGHVREYAIGNVDRTVGAGIAGLIARAVGDRGLPDRTLTLRFRGSAGQSWGAFTIAGMRMELTGEANDYVGKGMAGAELVVRHYPRTAATADAHDQYTLGNTCLYGATGGTLLAAGLAGERFAVRNSGATAVVEGVGDHGCEYMTGGCVVVLGPVGRNFGAGMTGGTAWVLDAGRQLDARLNDELVEAVAGSPAELEQLRALVARHVDATGSSHAAALLADWTATAATMRLVRPRDTPVPAVSERLLVTVAE